MKIEKARLADIDVEEVSYVDKAATKRKFLFVKRDTSGSNEGGENLNQVLIKRFKSNDAIAKALEQIDGGLSTIEKAIKEEIEKKDLPEEEKAALIEKRDEFELFKAEINDHVEELFLDKADDDDDDDEEETEDDEDTEEEYKGKKSKKTKASHNDDEDEEEDEEEEEEEEDEEKSTKAKAGKVKKSDDSKEDETEEDEDSDKEAAESDDESETVKKSDDETEDDSEEDELDEEESKIAEEITKEMKEIEVIKADTRKIFSGTQSQKA